MKTCIIFNPAARGDKANRFRARLGALSAQSTLKPTLAAGAGRGLAAEAVRGGFDVIVAAGGDGTINEVVNGIGDEPDGFTRVCLALLPLGTMNVFARELGVSFDLEHAWQTAQGGRESRVDVARADFAAPTGTARRYFVQLAGAGWDSRAVAQVDLNLKRRIGALAYIVAGLKAWREGLPSVTVSDGQRTLAGPLVAVGNGQYYGGSFRLFPRADLRDGLLDVTVFRRVGVGSIVRAGWGLLANRLYREGGAGHFCASSVELTSAAPMPLQLEGESVGHLPARLSVVPKALRVRVP